jgi:hypothetical protein
MSPAEVFEEVEPWNPEQRRELAWRLKILDLIHSPEVQAEMSRRIDEIKRGNFVTREQLLERLAKRGITLSQMPGRGYTLSSE